MKNEELDQSTKEQRLLNTFGNYLAINSIKCNDSNQVAKTINMFLESDYYSERKHYHQPDNKVVDFETIFQDFKNKFKINASVNGHESYLSHKDIFDFFKPYLTPKQDGQGNKWISVDVEPKSDSYLVWPNKYSDTAYYHNSGEFKGKWTIDDANGYESVVYPEYYQSLPSPPATFRKEGEGNG